MPPLVGVGMGAGASALGTGDKVASCCCALAVECLVIYLCPLGVFSSPVLVGIWYHVSVLLEKGCVYNLRKEKCKVL